MKKTVIIGISGGIAAVKTIEIIKLLKKKNIDIEVIMTSGASRIINPKDIEKETGKSVYNNLFSQNIDTEQILKERKVEHIDLAGRADLIVVAPATANLIAKLAHGIADDYLTTAILASICQIVICPSMNLFMWTNEATQKNVRALIDRGYIILGPGQGMLACGYEGKGRLIDTQTLVSEINKFLSKTDCLKNKKALVTAGGTREYIDGVRFIGNKSSGKMGVAIAEALSQQGSDVLLVRAENSVHPRYKIKEELFETVEDLENILKKNIPKFDVCFHVAAVSDFRVKKKIEGKLDSKSSLSLDLVPIQKILNTIKKINPKIVLIGFKAGWNLPEKDLITKAKDTLIVSDADFIIANDVGKAYQGFDSDKNAVTIIDKAGNVKKIPLSSKTVIAEKIVGIIFKPIKCGEE